MQSVKVKFECVWPVVKGGGGWPVPEVGWRPRCSRATRIRMHMHQG